MIDCVSPLMMPPKITRSSPFLDRRDGRVGSAAGDF
jgi:hypothetical protein